MATRKLFIINEIVMAERVGFVPGEPTLIKHLGATATARIRQIH